MTRFDVIYNAVLIITIATTMVSAWPLRNSARNISFTVAVSIFTEDFSLIERQVIVIKMKNKTAIISAK